MIDRGNADFVGFEYTLFTSKENSPVVHVQGDFCRRRTDISCNHFAINPHGRNVGPIWNGIVEFGQFARRSRRKL